MNEQKMKKMSRELFTQIDKLTSDYIDSINMIDDVRLDIILMNVAINYLLKVFNIQLSHYFDIHKKDEAIENFKKMLNEELDSFKTNAH
jgi:hypothetical protein